MDLYGLIGYPLGHSFSKDYFDMKFRMEGIDAEYRVFPIRDVAEIEVVIKDNPELRGLNVTSPYKISVMPFLQRIDEGAKRIGSVNVIKISGEGDDVELEGYNTDGSGFETALLDFLPHTEFKALILGNGGAGCAVRYILDKLEIEHMTVSRNASAGMISYGELTEEIISDRKLIINTTPLGMYPDETSCTDIPYQQLGPGHYFFDLIYNPEETLFLKKGVEQGAAIENGLKMFYEQAKAAWQIIYHRS